MTKKNLQILSLLFCVGVAAGGCASSIPQNTSTDTQTFRVSGSPQERIQKVESNSSLTQAQKDLYIKTIKDRNNIK